MKKTICAILALVLTLGMAGIPVSAQSFTRFAIELNGDVNGDGDINSLDAALVLRYDVGLVNEFGNSRPIPELTEEVDAELCLAYYEHYFADGNGGYYGNFEESGIEISSYLGCYNGYHVAYFLDWFIQDTMAEETIIVAGYVFEYGTGRQHEVIKDGQFYTISQAYENGYLTAEDVYNIAVLRGTSPKEATERDFEGRYCRSSNKLGNVNDDRFIDNLDAALILKYDAGLIE